MFFEQGDKTQAQKICQDSKLDTQAKIDTLFKECMLSDCIYMREKGKDIVTYRFSDSSCAVVRGDTTILFYTAI